MRRRDFVGLIGGATAWPLAARAQQDGRVRRVGVLMAFAENDPESPPRVAAISQGLQELGWQNGRNIRIDYRFATGAGSIQSHAAELVRLAPNVLVVSTTASLQALQLETSAIPIVFVAIGDPVGSGIVASLARPGGNVTGFSNYEYSIAGKWVEILKEVDPTINRVMVLFNPQASSLELVRTIATTTPSLGIELNLASVRDAAEIDHAFDSFGRVPNSGLITLGSAVTNNRRQQIVLRAAAHRVPAIYPFRFYVTSGGLLSYGNDPLDQYRRAATYVDRILKGVKPADLPVQQPTKFELLVNLSTAKAIGLTIPESFLLRADEVIE